MVTDGSGDGRNGRRVDIPMAIIGYIIITIIIIIIMRIINIIAITIISSRIITNTITITPESGGYARRGHHQ